MPFDQIAFIRCHEDDLSAIEQAYIRALRPKGNRPIGKKSWIPKPTVLDIFAKTLLYLTRHERAQTAPRLARPEFYLNAGSTEGLI